MVTSTEAEETLNKLLQAKSKIGQWRYSKEQDFHLVSGVCVQIKGEIQYRLGHWSKGAALLIQSLGFFGSLPQPDKKVCVPEKKLIYCCPGLFGWLSIVSFEQDLVFFLA